MEADNDEDAAAEMDGEKDSAFRCGWGYLRLHVPGLLYL